MKAHDKPRNLVILDLNGVLIDRKYVGKASDDSEHEGTRIGHFLVYKRPGLDNFLRRLFKLFDVAVWSSAKKWNVNQLVDFIFCEPEYHFSDLKFVWCQEQCTRETHPDEELAKVKPLFVKSLDAVWEKFPEYNPGNTFFVDDTPEKIRSSICDVKEIHVKVKTWKRGDE